MANEEQLRILGQGVDAWNKWRKEHPDIRADFSERGLSGANLSVGEPHRGGPQGKLTSDGRTSAGRTLKRCRPQGAHLSMADLSETDLQRGGPHRGDLERGESQRSEPQSEPNLKGRTSTKQDLSKANLTRGESQWSEPRRASLSQANLRERTLKVPFYSTPH